MKTIINALRVINDTIDQTGKVINHIGNSAVNLAKGTEELTSIYPETVTLAKPHISKYMVSYLAEQEKAAI